MKKKISYYPHSFLVSIPIFIVSMIVLMEVFKIELLPSILVSIADWIFAANSHAQTDYLQK